MDVGALSGDGAGAIAGVSVCGTTGVLLVDARGGIRKRGLAVGAGALGVASAVTAGWTTEAGCVAVGILSLIFVEWSGDA